MLVLFENLSDLGELLLISVKDLIILSVKGLLDDISSVNVLKVREQVKGSLRRSQGITEGILNE